ncbi:putative 50S ribosomal protein L1-like [Capsicum annuum]|nr:putative 50S ribosomal protein L1-like [Capsicum annuum]
MLLKNLMEDKQLNLNQPFLTVRRVSPTVASGRDETKKTDYSVPTVTHPPRYKSELKSGPVRNPGAVPFRWEQSPGKPKYESKRQIRALEKPPIAPRLPPGRKLKDNQDSDKAHENRNISESQTGNAQDSAPSCVNLDEKVKKIESIDCSKDVKQDKGKHESEDVDEVYMAALNELTRTESFFLNCSISGLSGLDEPEAKPSGTSLTDPQARDFMIDRFLPAAKAMASEKTLETPHYAPRKQSAVEEQPRQLKKVVNGDKRPQLRYGPSFALRYSQFQDNDEEESDDDSCYDGNLSYKVCGLLPRFCLKSSFCLMNPVPGMNARTRVPMSPAGRTQTGSSSTTSCSGSEYEQSKSESTLQKDSSDCFQEFFDYQNNAGEADSAAPLAEKTLHVDIVHKVESPIMKSCSPKAERPFNLHDEGQDILKKMTEQKPSVDSSHSYFAKPVDGGASKPNIQKEVFNAPSSSEYFNNGGEMMALMASGQAQDRYQDAVPSAKPKADVKRSIRKQTVQKEKLENSRVAHSNLPAPPPLPKSPSDSWLCRTLPSLSTKNPSSRSYVGTGISPNSQSCKPLSSDPKWETIVKTAKRHHQHLRYTEEMMALPPIPEAQ